MSMDCKWVTPCQKTALTVTYAGSTYLIRGTGWDKGHFSLLHPGDPISFNTHFKGVSWRVHVGKKTYQFWLVSVNGEEHTN